MAAETPQTLVVELETMRHAGAGSVPFVRLFGLARSALGTATRLLSRRCFSLVLLLGVPTTVLAFLLRTLSAMQAARRRRALADVAEKRRQEAHANIAIYSCAESANSAAQSQDVLKLGFVELQKRLKDGKVTAQTVLTSYRVQAGRAHAQVNCLTEFLPEAVAVAQVSPQKVGLVPFLGTTASALAVQPVACFLGMPATHVL